MWICLCCDPWVLTCYSVPNNQYPRSLWMLSIEGHSYLLRSYRNKRIDQFQKALQQQGVQRHQLLSLPNTQIFYPKKYSLASTDTEWTKSFLLFRFFWCCSTSDVRASNPALILKQTEGTKEHCLAKGKRKRWQGFYRALHGKSQRQDLPWWSTTINRLLVSPSYSLN